ncbi:MAG: CBS domain-containing protein [Bacteroidales bacterium]|nr:CBS domain-containing protein [Bacteroidales bacterium]
MGKNADRFLTTFNAMERHLQYHYNNGSHGPFRMLVKTAANKDALYRRFQEDLFIIGDLRNVIVHNDRYEGRTIAEPADEIVGLFEYIWHTIEHPEKVTIFEKKVLYCFADDKLEKALNIMLKHKITLIPVLQNGEIIDVLNGNHITWWLAKQILVSTEETTILEVLEDAEYRRNFRLIPRYLSVFDAAEMFRNSYKEEPKNRYYDALIITEKGRKEEKMTGIIVLKDIAQYIIAE